MADAFTVVFAGNVRALPFNPLKVETPFGKPRAISADDVFARYDEVEQQRDELCAVLQRYMDAYPAFRIKPTGAPGSVKRIEQENLMALEDAARAAIAKATGGAE